MRRKSHTNTAALPNTAKNDAQNSDEVKFFSPSVLYLQQLDVCKVRNLLGSYAFATVRQPHTYRSWLDCLILRIKASHFPETSVNIYQSAWRHVQEYLKIHQHQCEKLKDRNESLSMLKYSRPLLIDYYTSTVTPLWRTPQERLHSQTNSLSFYKPVFLENILMYYFPQALCGNLQEENIPIRRCEHMSIHSCKLVCFTRNELGKCELHLAVTPKLPSISCI